MGENIAEKEAPDISDLRGVPAEQMVDPLDVPLNYQISEYDCGPVSVINGISYAFPRKSVRPDLISGVYRYCLDGFNSHGAAGVTGTSGNCMRFLAEWFNQYGRQRKFPIHSEFLSGDEVHLGENSRIVECIRRRGAAVVQCWLGCRHYVLITGLDEEKRRVYIFDPYYPDKVLRRKDIKLVDDHPMSYNRVIPYERLESRGRDYYNIGETDRECLLIENIRHHHHHRHEEHQSELQAENAGD